MADAGIKDPTSQAVLSIQTVVVCKVSCGGQVDWTTDEPKVKFNKAGISSLEIVTKFNGGCLVQNKIPDFSQDDSEDKTNYSTGFLS